MKRRIGEKRTLRAESLESRQLLHGGAIAGAGEPPTTTDRVEGIFQRYDANTDGELSQEEVSDRLWDRVSEADGEDENTTVSSEELTSYLDAQTAERMENGDAEDGDKQRRQRHEQGSRSRGERGQGDQDQTDRKSNDRDRGDRNRREQTRSRRDRMQELRGRARLSTTERVDAFFAANDTNGDGLITDADEVSAELLSRLADTDVDGDDVSAADLVAHHEAAQQERAQARFDARFAKLDDNGDGAINEEEAGRSWERLSEADSDGDGSVTATELQDFLDAQRAEREAERETRQAENEDQSPVEAGDPDQQAGQRNQRTRGRTVRGQRGGGRGR